MTQALTDQAQKCLAESLEVQRAIKQFLTENQPAIWSRDRRFQLDVSSSANEHVQMATQIATQDFQACMTGAPRSKIIQR